MLEPEEGPDKYLYMAQLHEGREALGHYEKGLELLRKKLADGADRPKEEEVALRQRVCMAYCSVGELFLTDLCFDADAETRCQVRLQMTPRRTAITLLVGIHSQTIFAFRQPSSTVGCTLYQHRSCLQSVGSSRMASWCLCFCCSGGSSHIV